LSVFSASDFIITKTEAIFNLTLVEGPVGQIIFTHDSLSTFFDNGLFLQFGLSSTSVRIFYLFWKSILLKYFIRKNCSW